MKKYPFVKQQELKDCGATCLSMIIEYYKGYIPLSKLKEMTKTSKKGVSAFHIVQTLNKIGFKAKGIKIHDLNNVILPAIAHVTIDNKFNHYVVIYKIEKDSIVIADPATKIKKMKLNDFYKIYNDILIICFPVKKIPLYNKQISIYKYTFNILKKHKIIYIKLFILSLIITCLSVFSSFHLESIINNLTSKNSLLSISILFGSLFIIKNILDYIRNRLLIKLTYKIDFELSNDIFLKLISLPYKYFKNRTTGEVISRINDLSKLKEMISKVTVTLLLDLTLLIFSSIILFIISYKLFIITLIIFTLYAFIIIIFQNKFKNQIEDIQEEKALLNSYMNESITSFETIKGLSIEKKIIKKYKENNVLLLNKLKKLENLYNFEYFLKEAISSVGQVVILFIGSILIINNSLTLGKLISFLFLYSFFLEPIKNIIDLNKEIKEALSALNRINDLIYEEKDIIDTYNKINNIEIKNLSYTHDDINKTLNNINLKINKGEKIMMIGSSGSGKSTLLKILKRYYKVDNEKIFFDNKDINKYSLKTINKNITYISQNEILYTDTVYNNLNLDRNININDIEQIIKLCYLDNILDNNLKLNTLVEENGFNLSGGERQRLILARGILNNFEILILDESLSQVDINLERKILKNILNKFKDKTIIFVSHRYNNIDLFDRVINIEKGKIKNIEKNRTSYLPREELYD